jgi:hypothetical protein
MLRRVLPLALLLTGAVSDQDAYDLPPISYSRTAPTDPVARLDSSTLAHEPGLGYLRSFLTALDIPATSQTLVFSKTSFQRQRIGPRTPRALYFNDDVYVGWVQGGDVLEVSGVDPQLGAVFYTLSQAPAPRPKLVRQTDNCLQCHDSRGLTLGVPGHIVRSVFAGDDGTPVLTRGTFHTTDQSPYEERWGGWYATGDAGAMRHLGNAVYDEDSGRAVRLPKLDSYLAPSSDMVALLVLEHQTHAHNLITRANHESRLAIVQSNEIHRLLGTSPKELTDGARSRIRSYCEPLVEALFFSGEIRLPNPVKGDTSFARDFEKRGPFDRRGRSLRDFDLRTRLFKHPLSFLVYSKAFAGLPAPARDYIRARMQDILAGRDDSKPFAHLTAEDRAALQEILLDTVPGWK